MKIKLIQTMAFAYILFSAVNAIAIIPPVIYFVTLSISTFLMNAIVSLLIFGFLSGLSRRKYLGKSLYETLGFTLSIIGTGFLTIFAMVVSIILLSPIDLSGVLICGLFSALLAFCAKMLLSFRQFLASDARLKRSIILSGIALALFVAFATSLSAAFSMEVHRIPLKASGSTELEYGQSSESGISKLGDMVFGIANSAPQMAKTYAAKESGSQLMPTPSQAPKAIEKVLWFIPISGDICEIHAQGFVKSFQPTFNCYFEENGAKQRIYCPVFVNIDSIKIRGDVQFVGTGGCAGSTDAIATDSGFENIRRDA